MELNELSVVGINIEDGIARFSGNRELYVRFLRKFLEDDTFADLCRGIEAGSSSDAFQAAHTLKGITGNLSIVSLESQLTQMVKLLRVGSTENIEIIFEKFKSDYASVTEAIRTYVL